jgi:hypothetical protein
MRYRDFTQCPRLVIGTTNYLNASPDLRCLSHVPLQNENLRTAVT